MPFTRDKLSALTATASIGAGTTFTVTFTGGNPVAGSSVVLAIGINGQTVSSVADNGTTPATWVQDVTKTGTANHISYLYRADNVTAPSAGNFTLTVTIGGSGSGVSVSAGAASYLGKLAGGPVATNTGTATSGTITTNSVTPSVAGSLFAATFQNNSSNTADAVTLTNGNFTSRLVQNNGSAGQVYGFADAIENTTSADACTWTVATGTDTYSSAIAVYSPAAAASQPDTPKILPGPTWFDLFKPYVARPRPYLADRTALNQASVAAVIPPPVTSLTGTVTRPQDVPEIQAGPSWLRRFKPGKPKPLPVLPFAISGEAGALNLVIPPLVTSLTGTVTRPQDMPGILPGTTWLARYKPFFPRPRPPAPPSPPTRLLKAPLTVLLPGPATSISGTHLRAPENLGAVLVTPTPDGFLSVVTPDATLALADYAATLVLADLGGSTQGWTMQTAPLTLNEFNDVTIDMAITQNGSPYNLSGVTVNMLLKTVAGTPDANALTFSSGGVSPAITITNAAGGLAVCVIPNTDLDAETYSFYRVDVVNGGLTNTTLYGPILWITL